MIFTDHGPLGPPSRLERAALVAGLLLAAVLMAPLRGYLTDDTFIHLQFARHLAAGHGPVFNLGERVYGCTSPLWVALLAAGMTLGLDGLAVARAIGGLATLASVALVLQLARRMLRTPALIAAATLAWAAHAWMLRWSLSGMETPLAVALVLAGFVAFTEGKEWGARPVRTGTLWALAALTRPEAGLLLLLWGMFLLVDANSRAGARRLLAGALPPLVLVGGWLLFARVYYGSWLPQTLVAKSAGEAAFAARAEILSRGARIVGVTDGALVALLALALIAGRRRVWTRGPLGPDPRGTRSGPVPLRGPGAPRAQRLVPWAWVIAVPALYLVRGVPMVSRYLLPLLPVLALLAWRAGESWVLGPGEPAPRARRGAAALGLTLALLVLAQNLTVYRADVVPQVRSFTAGLEGSLIPLGRWLRANTPPTAAVAAPDIGALGYFSERRIVDLGGLVSPRMVPWLEREEWDEAAANFHFAEFSRPEYLVDRAPRPGDLPRRSRYASALDLLRVVSVPNLGITHPVREYYSLYRIDWAKADSIRASR